MVAQTMTPEIARIVAERLLTVHKTKCVNFTPETEAAFIVGAIQALMARVRINNIDLVNPPEVMGAPGVVGPEGCSGPTGPCGPPQETEDE
jgi:hypothetical protein